MSQPPAPSEQPVQPVQPDQPVQPVQPDQPDQPDQPNPWAPPQEGTHAPDPTAPGTAQQDTLIGGPPSAPYAPGPGYGYGPTPPYGYGYAPQPQAPRNGMVVTSLVLGIVGFALGVPIVLFWLSWLPSLLGLIFGIIALGQINKGTATGKVMAIFGLITGALGLALAIIGAIISFALVKSGVDEYDRVLQVEASETPAPKSKELTDAEKKLAELEASRSAEDAAEADAAKPKTFGTTYTFRDGVTIKVDKPVPYTADSIAAGHTKGYKTFKVKITMTNGSQKKFDTLYALPRFKDADEAEVQMVFDGNVPSSFRGSLHPGKTKTGTYAFDLPPEAAGTASVEMAPGVGYPKAVWSGPTR
ncbi:DUF4190 domain-containing protein [Streptomyces sp. NBC_00237]|uniref:DUF4190 domain-containing protein n=1 Tax=Streptomyces sp. NBC_00237 TaxID=2975687 RepID=UPI00225052E3|nr:DUF4190 domain-containing protein [Streptomyces sp. NBC_00237]MCX5201607.1 DUF4190 domain-containing protein [Streptomyces sp. NBC_00237]